MSEVLEELIMQWLKENDPTATPTENKPPPATKAKRGKTSKEAS
jgi:hypothetical protein